MKSVGEEYAELKKERDEWKARAESRQEEIERQMTERQREWQGKQNEAASYARATAELRARAEQAEKEAERLRRQREEDAETVRAAIDARERAEADNAALLSALRDATNNARRDDPDVWDRVWAVRDAEHPGAALLERVRALEAVRDAAVPFAHAETSSEEERQALRDACAGADALKERKS